MKIIKLVQKLKIVRQQLTKYKNKDFIKIWPLKETKNLFYR